VRVTMTHGTWYSDNQQQVYKCFNVQQISNMRGADCFSCCHVAETCKCGCVWVWGWPSHNWIVAHTYMYNCTLLNMWLSRSFLYWTKYWGGWHCNIISVFLFTARLMRFLKWDNILLVVYGMFNRSFDNITSNGEKCHFAVSIYTCAHMWFY
jgi:hypothetical protein